MTNIELKKPNSDELIDNYLTLLKDASNSINIFKALLNIVKNHPDYNKLSFWEKTFLVTFDSVKNNFKNEEFLKLIKDEAGEELYRKQIAQTGQYGLNEFEETLEEMQKNVNSFKVVLTENYMSYHENIKYLNKLIQKLEFLEFILPDIQDNTVVKNKEAFKNIIKESFFLIDDDSHLNTLFNKVKNLNPKLKNILFNNEDPLNYKQTINNKWQGVSKINEVYALILDGGHLKDLVEIGDKKIPAYELIAINLCTKESFHKVPSFNSEVLENNIFTQGHLEEDDLNNLKKIFSNYENSKSNFELLNTDSRREKIGYIKKVININDRDFLGKNSVDYLISRRSDLLYMLRNKVLYENLDIKEKLLGKSKFNIPDCVRHYLLTINNPNNYRIINDIYKHYGINIEEKFVDFIKQNNSLIHLINNIKYIPEVKELIYPAKNKKIFELFILKPELLFGNKEQQKEFEKEIIENINSIYETRSLLSHHSNKPDNFLSKIFENATNPSQNIIDSKYLTMLFIHFLNGNTEKYKNHLDKDLHNTLSIVCNYIFSFKSSLKTYQINQSLENLYVNYILDSNSSIYSQKPTIQKFPPKEKISKELLNELINPQNHFIMETLKANIHTISHGYSESNENEYHEQWETWLNKEIIFHNLGLHEKPDDTNKRRHKL